MIPIVCAREVGFRGPGGAELSFKAGLSTASSDLLLCGVSVSDGPWGGPLRCLVRRWEGVSVRLDLRVFPLLSGELGLILCHVREQCFLVIVVPEQRRDWGLWSETRQAEGLRGLLVGRGCGEQRGPARAPVAGSGGLGRNAERGSMGPSSRAGPPTGGARSWRPDCTGVPGIRSCL